MGGGKINKKSREGIRKKADAFAALTNFNYHLITMPSVSWGFSKSTL